MATTTLHTDEEAAAIREFTKDFFDHVWMGFVYPDLPTPYDELVSNALNALEELGDQIDRDCVNPSIWGSGS